MRCRCRTEPDAMFPTLCLRCMGWFASVVFVLLVSCTTVKKVGGEIGGTAAEWIACPTDLIDCGHVYMCEAPANNDLGHVEICVNDDDAPEDLDAVEAMYGDCELTPRHQGLCLYCCGAGCGRGGNAYDGTWCPI